MRSTDRIMQPNFFDKRLPEYNTWLYLLCAVLFLHFVLVRVPLLPFPLFLLFGVPLFLIIVQRFLKKPNRFFTKESAVFLIFFFVYSLYVFIVNYLYDFNEPFLFRQAYKSIVIYLAIVGCAYNIKQLKIIQLNFVRSIKLNYLIV